MIAFGGGVLISEYILKLNSQKAGSKKSVGTLKNVGAGVSTV